MLSNEEKAKIKEGLESLFESVYLICDGYLVVARLQRISETKLGILVYVNGVFKGQWGIGKNQDEEAKRFYPMHKKQLFPEKKRKVLRIKPKDNYFYYRKQYFSTARVFVNHIAKNNKEIKIIDYLEYEKLMNEMEGEANR